MLYNIGLNIETDRSSSHRHPVDIFSRAQRASTGFTRLHYPHSHPPAVSHSHQHNNNRAPNYSTSPQARVLIRDKDHHRRYIITHGLSDARSRLSRRKIALVRYISMKRRDLGSLVGVGLCQDHPVRAGMGRLACPIPLMCMVAMLPINFMKSRNRPWVVGGFGGCIKEG